MSEHRSTNQPTTGGSQEPRPAKTSGYEARCRALVLACLPATRYANAWAPGCTDAVLLAALAERCQALDVSTQPADWQAGSFDLILLSELDHFEPQALSALARQARQSLGEGGTVLACHGRPQVEGRVLNGDAVHAVLDVGLGLHRLGRFLDADLRIDIWSTEPTSVGQREGLGPPGSAAL